MKNYKTNEIENIIKILEDYYSIINGGAIKTIFLNSDNNNSIVGFIEKCSEKFPDALIIKENLLELDTYFEPYYPFLKVIKEQIKNSGEKLDFVLEKANVYYFQRSLFKSYFEEKITSRYEELYNEEVNYERTEAQNSITRLFRYISSKKRIIFIIENIEKMKSSSITYIKHLIENNSEGRILFVFKINKNLNYTNDETRELWESLFDVISEKSTMLEIGENGNFEKIEKVETKNIIDKNRIEKIIELGYNCFNFFAFSEAREYLNETYEYISKKIAKVDEMHYKILLLTLGDINSIEYDYDNALLYYNLYLSHALYKNDMIGLVEGYRKIAIVYQLKDNHKNAEKTMKQSMKIALKIKDEHLLLKVKFVNFTIAHRRRYDEYWSQIVQMYEELVEQCERLKMYNMLASIHNMMVIDPAFYRSVDEDMACCDKSIRICKKYGNIYKLSAIYHVKGMVLSFVGKNRAAFMYYKKSEELKKQLNNKIELVRIYNGMGYGLFLVEDFTNALNYYNKALSMLKGVKSYDEIGITIYNIGILYFYAKNYKTALLCFEKVISIINILKIKEIPFHSIFGLYCVVAICALKVDNYVKTLEYLNRIKTINHTNNYEEIFYYRLFEALINKREHNYIEAENNFKEAYKLLEHPSLKILFSLLQLEFGLMYKELGQIEKANSLFEDGLYCSRETKQSFHEKLFLKELSQNRKKNVELNLKEISFELDSIVEYAKQEVIFNKLHKKIDEINFLNYLQQILLEKINSKEELLRKTMELFNNYFVADEIYLISKENELKMIYKAGSINMEDSIIFKIVEAFPGQHDELLILKAKQDERVMTVTDAINSLVIVPFVENGQVNGYVVFVIQKESFFFNEEDLRIISLAIKQLYVALRNKSLEESIENRNVEIENKNKELESIIEKLKIAQEQLIINEKLASVGKLAGGIAHEINNPLGVILSNVELIKQDIDEKKEIDRGSLFESIDMIEEGVKRVRDIIFNLKKYTVSTKGILSIFDVKDIINSSVSIFGKEMQNYNIKFYSEMNENYKIEGNYVDIVQVLTSIISNSIDALIIVDKETKYIKLSAYSLDNKIHIIIEDNGIGMTEDIKKKIFDPFFTTKDVGKGIGLGLSISYDILKKHNVSIFVESEKDKGTKVMLKFPEMSTGLNDNVRTDVFS